VNNLVPIDSIRRRHRETGRDRQPRNGHHPDCPYTKTVNDHCPICAAIDKGSA
jgi:hypothetical protein